MFKIAGGLFGILFLAVCGTTASAAIIASDTFAYPTNVALAGNNGGTGWAGAWGAAGGITAATVIDTNSNPLEFTPSGGQTLSGGNQALEVKLSGAAASQLAGARELASPLTETFYAGYLFRYDGDDVGGSNNTFSFHLSNSATNTTSFNFGVRGNTPGNATTPPETLNEFIVRSGTGGPVAGAFGGGDLVNGKEYFLLAKLTYSGTNYDMIDVWVDPAVNPGTPDLSLSLPAGTGLTSITHVFYRQAVLDATDIFVADGIVLSTNLRDILVPEPATVALLLCAALGLVGLTKSRLR